MIEFKGEFHQLTLVGKYDTTEKCFFKTFPNENDLIAYVVNMSKGGNKVHKIIKMDTEGNLTFLTIGFIDGKLDLINIGGIIND